MATSALEKQSDEPDEATNPQPRYGQLFVYDPSAAVTFRMAQLENAECFRSVMDIIDSEHRQVNPYVAQYQRLHETIARQSGIEPKQYELILMRNPQDDQCR